MVQLHLGVALAGAVLVATGHSATGHSATGHCATGPHATALLAFAQSDAASHADQVLTVSGAVTIPSPSVIGSTDIDLVGDVAVVTVRTTDFGFPIVSQNRVFVLERDASGTWHETFELQPPVGGPPEEIVSRAVLDDDRCAFVTSAGRALVYERAPDATWALVAQTPVTDFAGSLAFADGLLVTGRSLAPPSTPAGVEVRRLFGGPIESWSLNAPSTVLAIAVAGERIVVTGQEPLSGFSTGVHLFERDAAGVWQPSPIVPASDFTFEVLTYASIDLDGTRMVCGSSNGSVSAGHVYEEDASGVWSRVATLPAAATAAAVSRGRLAAAVPPPDPLGGDVVLFEEQLDGTWIEETRFVEPAGGAWGGFASALDATTLLVGSRGLAVGDVVGRVLVVELGDLYHGANELSLGTGGGQALALRADQARAGHPYILLGSMSGTSPATPLAPGVDLPLVPDVYTDITAGEAAPIVGAMGVLDANGHADARLFVVPGGDPSLAGLVLHHAFVAVDPVTYALFASNAVRVELVP